jgi:hypothetical protein
MAAELWSAPAPGALADLAPELGGAVAGQLALRVAPALLRELRDADAANRRNAAFAVGVWARAAPGALGPQLPALLQARAVSSLRRL